LRVKSLTRDIRPGLSEATDVYHAWIDAIEAANKDAKYEPEGSEHGDEAPVRRLERSEINSDEEEPNRALSRNRDRDSSEEPLMDPDAMFASAKKGEAEEDSEEDLPRRNKRAKIDSDSEDD
jgi:hypothetical protein